MLQNPSEACQHVEKVTHLNGQQQRRNMVDQYEDKSMVNPNVPVLETLENQQKYESLLELCHDGVLIVQDGKIKESNHVMAKMCGYALEEVLDTEFASFFHPEDVELVEKIYTRVIGNAKPIEIRETALMGKSGIRMVAGITAGRFFYNREPAVLFMVRVLTDRIEAEIEPENRSEMDPIAALSGGIPHDYNYLLPESQTETEIPIFGNLSS
jgi:PAS domain S-box-containing protein